MLTELENEPLNVGRIDVKELQKNPDIIRDKLDEKIHLLLDKYGYAFKINGFQWNAEGLIQADIIIVKKPDEVTTEQ